MPRVLCVFYYFPPSGGPGVQRGLKFVRYLPECGWQPQVLTVRRTAQFPVRDESLCAEIPSDLAVRRTRCPEFYGIYRMLTGQRGVTSLDIASHAAADRRGLRGLLRSLRGALFIPDGRAAWVPFAVRAGLRLVRESPVDLIFSSGPPFTCHLIGRALHRRTTLPWVADYRDPWTQATFYPPRPAWARRRDLRLEADCVQAAERSVVVGPTMAAEFRRRYPHVDPARFVVIPNGYDEEDFREPAGDPPDRLQITHTGSIFGPRAPDALLTALGELLADEPGFADQLCLTFAGRLDETLVGRLRSAPFDRVSQLTGYLPHAESVRLLRRSHLLLLLIGSDAQSRSMLTGKLFEYLAAGVPILALGPPDGDAARILRETGAGWIYAPADSIELRRRLRSVWQEYRRAHASPGATRRAPLTFGLQPNAAAVRAYSRRALTRRLAALFDELLR